MKNVAAIVRDGAAIDRAIELAGYRGATAPPTWRASCDLAGRPRR